MIAPQAATSNKVPASSIVHKYRVYKTRPRATTDMSGPGNRAGWITVSSDPSTVLALDDAGGTGVSACGGMGK